MSYNDSEIWADLQDREYRLAYCEGLMSIRLASQIHYLRKHRNWTQADLAIASGKAQPTVSALEDSCETASLSTLKKIAAAFDVALDVRFVAHSSFLDDSFAPDAVVPSFVDDASMSHGLRNVSPSVSTDSHSVVRLNDYRPTSTSTRSYKIATS